MQIFNNYQATPKITNTPMRIKLNRNFKFPNQRLEWKSHIVTVWVSISGYMISIPEFRWKLGRHTHSLKCC